MNTRIRSEEVNTVNTILENVEQILDGIALEDVDMPVYDLTEYLPQMSKQATRDPGC
jgi:hypothetical protein